MPYRDSTKQEKISKIDDKDRKLLNILSQNSRTKLTQMSRQVGLSVDGVKGRIKKLKESGVIERFSIIVNPVKLGFGIGSHIYIKLHNMTDERMEELIKSFKNNPRIPVFISMLGDYDIYAVLEARNTSELRDMRNEIRKKFNDLIDDWKEVIVSEVYKLEEYKF